MLISFSVLISILMAQTVSEKRKLERVIVLSRHNVRSPLSEHLAEVTPKPWPHWDEKNGYLTPKGVYLEGLMGDFFSKWLQGEGVLPEGCPDKNDVFVYANIKQRTKVSARAFVLKAFPDCNITVHMSDKSDPIFNPFVHNDTDSFKQIVLEKMQKILDMLQLNSSYELIENILDYKHSNVCEMDHKCDLETDMNTVKIVAGEKPTVTGPLKISNSALDAFLMQYYNGLALPDVAWGQLANDKSWNTLFELSEGYHNVIYNTTMLAKDIAFPLIDYLKNIFINKETKFSMLMGHDSNILTVLNGIRFKPYILSNQYEKAPIGGKIVFQKWSNSNKIFFLKIQYIYASTSQLRVGSKLTLSQPPQFQILELEDCPIDKDGFCPWEDFKKLLGEFGYLNMSA